MTTDAEAFLVTMIGAWSWHTRSISVARLLRSRVYGMASIRTSSGRYVQLMVQRDCRTRHCWSRSRYRPRGHLPIRRDTADDGRRAAVNQGGDDEDPARQDAPALDGPG